MGMRRLAQIARAIIDGGRNPDTPACVVMWGARPNQLVVEGTLSNIAERAEEAGATNPAVVIVGEVVALRKELSWYDRRPLFGKKILVPRPTHQASDTAKAIRERSAQPLLFAAIEITDPPDLAPLERAIGELEVYDWVLFTSTNGVERFFAALSRAGRDARALGRARLAAIGPRTARGFRSFGLNPDWIAEEYIGESLAHAILAQSPKRVLIPRALVAREELPQILRDGGVTVDVVPAYQTLAASTERSEAFGALFENDGVDVVLFTSSSMVNSVCDLLAERAASVLGSVTVASIGPITSKTLRARGIEPDVEAGQYTVAGLLDALEVHFAAPAV
jgi:uroporphyrinogen III methyltransferase/synthase